VVLFALSYLFSRFGRPITPTCDMATANRANAASRLYKQN